MDYIEELYKNFQDLKSTVFFVVAVLFILNTILTFVITQGLSKDISSLEQSQGVASVVCNFDSNTGNVVINEVTGQPDCYRLQAILTNQQEQINTLAERQGQIIQALNQQPQERSD